MSSRQPHSDRITRRSRAIYAGFLCFSLALTAGCASSDRNRFHPHPNHERHASTKADEATDPLTTDGSAEAKPAVSLPPVIYPDGQELHLTPPGTRLTFGTSATVASIDSEGRMLLWSVTPYDQVPLPLERVELLDPNAAANVAHYACYTFDIEFLGVVPAHTNHPLILNGLADTISTSVTPPDMTLGNINGDEVRRVSGGTDSSCGIPEASRLPTNQNDLVLGVRYTRGTIGVIDQHIQPEHHPASMVYRFDRKIPGIAELSTPPAPIMWTYPPPSPAESGETQTDPIPQ